MRGAPRMPNLHKNFTAFGMYRSRRFFPRLNLLSGIHARLSGERRCALCNHRALSDDQTRAGALCVIFSH